MPFWDLAISILHKQCVWGLGHKGPGLISPSGGLLVHPSRLVHAHPTPGLIWLSVPFEHAQLRFHDMIKARSGLSSRHSFPNGPTAPDSPLLPSPHRAPFTRREHRSFLQACPSLVQSLWYPPLPSPDIPQYSPPLRPHPP
jgi:hypothetical protein